MHSPNVFIARRTIVAGLALALSLLTACNSDSSAPTEPDGPPPSPTPSAVDVVYCRGAEPAWVAFQDGDGAWTQALPIASAQYTSFHHDFTSNRGAVARALQFASGLTSLSILYGVPSEIGLVSDTAFQQCSSDALKTLNGSVAGLELSNEKFNPFWAKAEELGAAIFIHPQPTDDLSKRLQGNGLLTNVIWNPLETTIALSHLIFEGTLDRFPGLKIIGAHGGGFLGSYMNRSDHGCVVFPEQCKPGLPKKTPTEYVKKLYFDSLVFTPEGLRHLAAEVGPGQIVVCTDFPYRWVSDPIDHVMKTPGLSDADREAILGGTAAKLLGLRGTS